MTGFAPEVKRLLIFRCPKLSDGSRVTLLTWLYCLESFGSLPSLQETANLRGCGRSTIQAHLKEAIEAGVLSKENFGLVSAYTFEWSRLAREMGFEEGDRVDFPTLVKAPAPKNTDASEMAMRVFAKSNVKTSNDLVMYFKAMYREKLGKTYETVKTDRSRMRLMLVAYGASASVNMITFFLTHRGRLCLGNTDIETLYKNRESIYEKTKNT